MTTTRRSHSLRARHLFSVAILGAIAAVSGACGADEISDSSGGKGGEANYAKSACNGCVQSSCTSEIDACRADPGCAAYLDCLGACPLASTGDADGECDAACPQGDSSESEKLIKDVQVCRRYGLGGACEPCGVPNTLYQAPPSQSCADHEQTAMPLCRSCFWKHCCDTWDACYGGSNPECDVLQTCIAACPDGMLESCGTACVTAHMAGLPALAAQTSCANIQCAAATDTTCDPSKQDACDTCLYTTCAQPFDALITDPQGYLEYLCVLDCSAGNQGVECIEACDDKYPTSRAKFLLWAECLDHACAPVC